MSGLIRKYIAGEGWQTVVDDGGGGSFNGGTITEPLVIDTRGVTGEAPLNITSDAGSSAIIYAYDGDGNYGLSLDRAVGLRLWSVGDGSAIFRVGPTGAVTISPTDDSASPAQVEIIAGAGSEVNGSEILQITGDTGSRLYGFDGYGQFTVDMYQPVTGRATSVIEVHPDGGGAFIVASFSSGLVGDAPTASSDGGVKLKAATVAMPARLGTDLHDVIRVEHDGKLGFFEATPVDKPTGVAVTAGGIHAALVSLGLIAA